jgi:uroporphyrin-III C-methyltransferase/precorrin-2 dehydrogenase/sirohydrochlorin ferrochelatase
LIHHGRGADTPIALIQQGTTRHQRVVVGTLQDLPEKVAHAGIKAPTLLIVGEVVSLREQLNWYHPPGE